MAVTSCIL